MPIELAIILATLLLRIAEIRMHTLNRRFLLKNGGKETAPALTSAFLLAESAAIIAIFAERFLLPKQVPFWQMHVGIVVLFAAFLLRLWVRRSLGRMWNLGLVYVPGVERISDGPYRFFAHPDYLGRFFEALGLALFLGSYYTLGVYLGVMMILLPRIVILERRQLGLLAN